MKGERNEKEKKSKKKKVNNQDKGNLEDYPET